MISFIQDLVLDKLQASLNIKLGSVLLLYAKIGQNIFLHFRLIYVNAKICQNILLYFRIIYVNESIVPVKFRILAEHIEQWYKKNSNIMLKKILWQPSRLTLFWTWCVHIISGQSMIRSKNSDIILKFRLTHSYKTSF